MTLARTSRMRFMPRPHRHQHGAFLVTTALLLLFLLGFMGIALDFGRLFVLRSELQTAVDSCALAASRELDGRSDAPERARHAGLVAGNLHRVLLQSQEAGLTATDIGFSDSLAGVYSASPVGAASYVRCQRRITGLAPWLLQAFDGFAGGNFYGQPQAVATAAVATLVPAQTSCIFPVAVCKRSDAFKPGEWLAGATNSNEDMEASGQFRWLDFTASGGGAREIKDIVLGGGQCDLAGRAAPIRLLESGKKVGVTDAWNTRFLAQGTAAPQGLLDTTGYAWYASDSTTAQLLWGRFSDTASGYAYHQKRHSPYQGDRRTHTEGLSVLSGQPRPATVAEHTQGFPNSRIVTLAEIDCSKPASEVRIEGFACMFMLHPLQKSKSSGDKPRMWMEYIGDATAATGNPCITAGLPGDGDGQRVPALVR